MGSLIDYAYTSRLSINESNCQSILSAASHLQFLDIVESCSGFLQSKIDLENVLDIMTLAETYSLTSLQKKAYCFMCANLLQFSCRREFNHLTPHQVESCLRLNFPVDCSEAQVLVIVIKWIKYDYRNRIAFTPLLMKQINFREIPHNDMDHFFSSVIKSMLTDSNFNYNQLQCQPSDCVNINVISVNNGNNSVRSSSPASAGRLLVLRWRDDKQQEEEEDRQGKSVSDPDIKDWTAFNTLMQNQQLNLMPNSVITTLSQQACDKSRNTLLNKRGMELAILKIGGFTGSSGVTNEITYHLPARHDSRWRYLTSVPHVDQCNFGTAVLRNQLFVVGGCFNQNDMQEHVHPFGFKYDPFTDCWATISPMRSERCRFQLVVNGGQVYALGGSGENEVHAPDSSCEVYDAEADEWHSIASIPSGSRSQHAACSASDSFIYVSGGLDQDLVLSSVFRYCVQSNCWQSRRSLTAGRADHSMIPFKDQILVCGGWFEDEETGARILHSAIDVYDIASDSWSSLTDIPTPRFHASVILIASRLFVIGGFHSDHTFDRASGAIECYDLDKKYWYSIEAYPQHIWEHATAVLHVPTCREDDLEVRPDRV